MTILRPISPYILLALLTSAMGTAAVTFGEAAEKPTKPYKLEGVATVIDQARLSIRDHKGREVSIQTAEDFREKVAVGSPVTAWCHREGEANQLDSLEYPPESFFVPAPDFVPQIKKVILLPSSAAGDAQALFDAIEAFLQSRLNWVSSHRMLAEEIRRRFEKASATALAVSAAEGNVDLAPLAESHRRLIRKIASETRVDAVLETEIELVDVKFKSKTARWDGIREPIASKGARVMSYLSPLIIHGHLPASTAVLKLWDAQGNLLWRHRRGYCVLALQVGIGNKFRDRPISEAVQNTTGTEDWLNLVFGSWLDADLKSRQASGK